MEMLYQNIKQRRRTLGLTQQQLAELLAYERSSIAKIEKGEVDLPLSKIQAFSDALSLPLPALLGLDAEAAFPEMDEIFASLNAAGREALLRYGMDLSSDAEYSHVTPIDRLRFIRHYTVAAAAGYAAPIEGEDYELVPCGPEVPARADFCIDISGDSMEPYIHDGQRVFVKRDESLRDFDVGIFFVDGDVYCKQWCVDYTGTTHLLSANSAREDASLHIPRDSGRSLVYFGKVLLDRKPPRPVYF